MKAEILRTYQGPNPVAPGPAILWTLDTDPATADAFVKAAWPILRERYRLPLPPDPPDDTDARVGISLLAAILGKALLNETRGLVADAGADMDAEGRVRGWLGFMDPALTVQAIRLAFHAINEAGNHRPLSDAFDEQVRQFHAAGRGRLDYIARILHIVARAGDIPVLPAPSRGKIWRYGWGRASRALLEAASDRDGAIGLQIARDKLATARLLNALGFPAAEHQATRDADTAVRIADALGGAVVIKPPDRGKGKGVSVGVKGEAAVRRAFAEALALTARPVIVERPVPGHDHRLLVVGGTLVAAARREPASVAGDGKRTVAELVAGLNRHRAADPVLARYLQQIAIDDVLLEHLARQGMTPATVLPAGATATLRGNANISTGGSPTDVLADVHPDVREMAEAIARNTGLHALGIDYITPDIARSWHDVPSAVIEINETPGLDVHVASGVSETELGRIILGPAVGRVPVALVIGRETEHAAMFKSLERSAASWDAGWRCGMMMRGRVVVGRTRLRPAPGGFPRRVAQLLLNTDCAAVLLCATPEEIDTHGFPVDRCDLTILTGSTAPAIATLADGYSTRTLPHPDGRTWPGSPAMKALADTLQPPPRFTSTD